MTAAGLIVRARELGVRLYVEDDRIKATPPGKLPTALKDAIKAAKPAVMRILAEENARAEAAMKAPAPCAECGSTRWAISIVDDAGSRTCADCATGRTALRRIGAAV